MTIPRAEDPASESRDADATEPAARIWWTARMYVSRHRALFDELRVKPMRTRAREGRVVEFGDGPEPHRLSYDEMETFESLALVTRKPHAGAWVGIGVMAVAVLPELEAAQDATLERLSARAWYRNAVPETLPEGLRSLAVRSQARDAAEALIVTLANINWPPTERGVIEELVMPALRIAADYLTTGTDLEANWERYRVSLQLSITHIEGAERVMRHSPFAEDVGIAANTVQIVHFFADLFGLV